MNTRADSPVHIMVIAASAERRASLTAMAARALHARLSTSASISLERIFQSGADILLIDVDSPALPSAVLRMAEALPDGSGVIVLADNPESRWVVAALRAGINAILAREITAEELRLGVQAADAGLVLLHPS